MKVTTKPFRIYVEKYHVQDGNIYPPRHLNIKRIGLVLIVVIAVVVALSSCRISRPAGCPDTWGKVGYK